MFNRRVLLSAVIAGALFVLLGIPSLLLLGVLPINTPPTKTVGGVWEAPCTTGRLFLAFRAYPANNIQEVLLTASWPGRVQQPDEKPGAWKVVQIFPVESVFMRSDGVNNNYQYIWDIGAEPDSDRPPAGSVITISFDVHALDQRGSNNAPNGFQHWHYSPSGCP